MPRARCLQAALEVEPSRILIVTTMVSGLGPIAHLALERLRRVGTHVRLSPIESAEVLELRHSVFGRVPYLARLAQRVHQASGGNCDHCIEIAEHLIRSKVAVYEEGSWHLPAVLDAASLPTCDCRRRDAAVRTLFAVGRREW